MSPWRTLMLVFFRLSGVGAVLRLHVDAVRSLRPPHRSADIADVPVVFFIDSFSLVSRLARHV